MRQPAATRTLWDVYIGVFYVGRSGTEFNIALMQWEPGRRDAELMLTAQECPLARFVNGRADVSMVRLSDDWHAVRRRYDQYYSHVELDQW